MSGWTIEENVCLQSCELRWRWSSRWAAAAAAAAPRTRPAPRGATMTAAATASATRPDRSARLRPTATRWPTEEPTGSRATTSSWTLSVSSRRWRFPTVPEMMAFPVDYMRVTVKSFGSVSEGRISLKWLREEISRESFCVVRSIATKSMVKKKKSQFYCTDLPHLKVLVWTVSINIL